MKFIIQFVIVLSLSVSSVFAQGDFWDALSSAKKGGPQASSSGSSPVKPPTYSTVSSGSSSVICKDVDNNLLSLRTLKSLLINPNDDFKVVHDSKSGQITIKANSMISNCNSMLKWELAKPTESSQHYVVQVKIVESNKCESGKCEYSVGKKEAGVISEESKSYSPNILGFKECVKDHAFSKNTYDPTQVIVRDVDETLAGAFSSAKNVLVANKDPEPKYVYAKVVDDSKNCITYESINKEPIKISSFDDAERDRLDEEAKGVCETDNYKKINDFLSRYKEYESSLGKIRNELILKQIKQLAADLKAGKDPKDLDLSIIDDFSELVVTPLIAEANQVYKDLSKLPEGSEKKEKQKKLDELLTLIKSYRKEPYLSQANVDKLVSKGYFEEAEKANDYRLALQFHSSLGKKQNNILVTPEVAQANIEDGKVDFTAYLKDKRREYEVRTGEVTGKSAYYADLAQSYRDNIMTRATNYQKAANDEILKMTSPAMCPQGSGSLCGYCYKYFRNTAKCVADAQACIQNLQVKLQEYNAADAAIAKSLDQKANQYADWEAEGQRHVAQENGDVVEDDETNDDDVPAPGSTTAPTSTTTADNTNYNFNYTNPAYQAGQQGQQQYPGYNQYQQQNSGLPYNNYFNVGAQGQFQMQGGAGAQNFYGQPQQFGGIPNYYGQPQQGQQPWMTQGSWGAPQQQFNPYGGFSGQYGSPYQQFPQQQYGGSAGGTYNFGF